MSRRLGPRPYSPGCPDEEPTGKGLAMSNWGRWGDDDERGAANLLTGDVVLAACAAPAAGSRLQPRHRAQAGRALRRAAGSSPRALHGRRRRRLRGARARGLGHRRRLPVPRVRRHDPHRRARPRVVAAARCTTGTRSARCAAAARPAAASRRRAAWSPAACCSTSPSATTDDGQINDGAPRCVVRRVRRRAEARRRPALPHRLDGRRPAHERSATDPYPVLGLDAAGWIAATTCR